MECVSGRSVSEAAEVEDSLDPSLGKHNLALEVRMARHSTEVMVEIGTVVCYLEDGNRMVEIEIK
jgi:hypothetical protein